MPRFSFLRAALHLQRPHMNFGILICDVDSDLGPHWAHCGELMSTCTDYLLFLDALQVRTSDSYLSAREPDLLPEHPALASPNHVFPIVIRIVMLFYPVGLTPYRTRRGTAQIPQSDVMPCNISGRASIGI